MVTPILASLMAVGGNVTTHTGKTATPARPNLFYILADDYGWANVGFHSAQALTPTIDSLATTEGFEITRHYAYRFCSPSRSSLMSGRLPFHVNQNN